MSSKKSLKNKVNFTTNSKTMKALSCFLLSTSILLCQNFTSPELPLNEIVNKVSLDSLISKVRILSGEDSVMIGDSIQLISFRGSNTDNEFAAQYIKQELIKYGLETEEQTFGSYGKNIYAIKRGSSFPKSYYIICAHYDAVDYYSADDNASGTSAVLEAARIISEYQLQYSVIFAFFDEEEIGLRGSKHFANEAANDGMDILGVVNLDMIAWDSDNDRDFEIHSNLDEKSLSIADSISALTMSYDLLLDPIIFRNGTNRSDHAPFWDYEYPGVLLIEELFGDDFNPYYHSSEDRIDKFNLSYFHNMTKIATLSIASFASINNISFTTDQYVDEYKIHLTNYPNPFNNSTIIEFSLPKRERISIDLYSSVGERIEQIFIGEKDRGRHQLIYSNDALSSNIYFLILRTAQNQSIRKILLLK